MNASAATPVMASARAPEKAPPAGSLKERIAEESKSSGQGLPAGYDDLDEADFKEM